MIFVLLSWLGLVPTFQKTKCKKLLSTTMERIKLLRSRREAQLRQLRIDVAKLLQLGKEQKAQVWIGRICKELSLLSVYRKISAYCESVQVNLRDIAGHDQCPTNLEEQVAGLCFAASRCADLPELQELREMFAMKYGKKFVSSAQDLEPDCHVNREFWECLCAKDPPDHLKQVLLEEIIAQYMLKQGNEQALQQHEQDFKLILDSHEFNPCKKQQEDVDPTPLDVVESRNDERNGEDTGWMQDPAVVSTVHEEDLGTTEVAQELANRKKAAETKQSRRSAFKRACNKRRQEWLNKSDEEGNNDDSNVTVNAIYAEGTTAVMQHHEAPNQHAVLYVKQSSLTSPPQRPPPPPPPNQASSLPAPPHPPNQALPPPPLRTMSMPSFHHIQHGADHTEVPPPFHSSTMAKKQYNQSFDWTHVHPRLPNYEDLVANFTALKH